MIWINFLHLYQPANSNDYNIKEAADKSYTRIISNLENNSHLCFTLNINGCLLDRLAELGYSDLIKRLRVLLQKKRIELVGTLAYHPLAPLISEKEVEKQIDEQVAILRKYFGKTFKLKGFFLPEMAYSSEVARIIKRKGYQWLILDEISCSKKIKSVDYQTLYLDKHSGLKLVFRSRPDSSCYVPNLILSAKKDFYLTATDAELYGLRHEDPDQHLEKVCQNKKIETKLISDYLRNLKHREAIEVRPSSWETTEKEIKKGDYYALWLNQNNKIQKRMWALANFVADLEEKYQHDSNYFWFRWHLVRGLTSCSFWWASGRDFSHNFGPFAWNPEETEKGINELVKAVRSLQTAAATKLKIKAENKALIIKKMLWRRHWQHFSK
jgi:hypothetical protein